MRRFSYVWKSSDGERHSDEMRARCKDDVFDALRKRGIRPVKVEALPMPLRWRIAWCAALLAIAVSMFAANQWRTAERRERLGEFRSTCETVIGQHGEQMSSFRLTAEAAGDADFPQRLEKGFRLIEISRSRLRLAYRDFGGRAHGDGERLYGHYTAILDADLERLDDLLAIADIDDIE